MYPVVPALAVLIVTERCRDWHRIVLTRPFCDMMRTIVLGMLVIFLIYANERNKIMAK